MLKCYREVCSQHLKCDHLEFSVAPLLSVRLLIRLHTSMLRFAGLFVSFGLAQDFKGASSNDLSETSLDMILTEGLGSV